MKFRLPLSMIAFLMMFIGYAIVSTPAVLLVYVNVPSELHNANAMWIEPSCVDLSTDIYNVGYKFNVTVWVNITSVPSSTQVVSSWQFVMSYNKSQLNATECDYTEGTKSQFFSNITTMPVEPDFGSLNTTYDYVMHCEFWVTGSKRTVPGYGSLSWVEFEVIAKPPEGEGYTSLIGLITTGVRRCKILDDDLTETPLTAHHSVYKFGAGTYDIALTDVRSSKTIVGQGYCLNVSVAVENQGNFTETFNVTVYHNETAIVLPDGKNYITITLSSGKVTTVAFMWNTTSVTKGNYSIVARAIRLSGETDTTDNTYTGGTVQIVVPGDINADKIVDVFDLVFVVRFYGIRPACYGVPSWSACNADINCDGIIDVFDLVIISLHYGETDP